MQTLFTVPDKSTGGIRTELHVSSYTQYGLYVVVYISDEWGTHKNTIRRTFTKQVDYLYHRLLRKKIKEEGGIIHTRISSIPLPKTKHSECGYKDRDCKGRFKKRSK